MTIPSQHFKARGAMRSVCCLLAALFAQTNQAEDTVLGAVGSAAYLTTAPSLILTSMGLDYTSGTQQLEGLLRFKTYAYAREDAAAYIASQGDIHGAQLERAWRSYLVSDHEPKLNQSAFAEEVMVWN